MALGPFERVEPGSQVLVNTDRGIVLDTLPSEAYENLLVVSTTRTPRKVEEAVRAGGGNPSNVGVIPVAGSSTRYDGPLWTTDRVDPSDLTGLSMRLSDGSRYLQPGSGWVVFDNMTVLLMYAPEERVYRLLASIVGTFRERDVRGLYGIVQSAMSDETYNRFLGIYDDAVSQ